MWRYEGPLTTAINASPVVAGGVVYVVNGLDEVFALDTATGALRWQLKLDPAGFDWGNATVGTPAVADNVLVVPTLYRDLVALDATTGFELWRFAGAPSQGRATPHRGAPPARLQAPPAVTRRLPWGAGPPRPGAPGPPRGGAAVADPARPPGARRPRGVGRLAGGRALRRLGAGVPRRVPRAGHAGADQLRAGVGRLLRRWPGR